MTKIKKKFIETWLSLAEFEINETVHRNLASLSWGWQMKIFKETCLGVAMLDKIENVYRNLARLIWAWKKWEWKK